MTSLLGLPSNSQAFIKKIKHSCLAFSLESACKWALQEYQLEKSVSTQSSFVEIWALLKRNNKKIKTQPKRTSLGAGLVPVGLKYVCFPGFCLLILVQAPTGMNRRSALGAHHDAPRLGSSGSVGWGAAAFLTAVQLGHSRAALQPIWSAGRLNPTICIQENLPCSSAGFLLFKREE